jgi:hypothetical protein
VVVIGIAIFYAAMSRTTTSINVMSTYKNGSGAVGYATIATIFLFSMFESMLSIMLVNLLAT